MSEKLCTLATCGPFSDETRQEMVDLLADDIPLSVGGPIFVNSEKVPTFIQIYGELKPWIYPLMALTLMFFKEIIKRAANDFYDFGKEIISKLKETKYQKLKNLNNKMYTVKILYGIDNIMFEIPVIDYRNKARFFLSSNDEENFALELLWFISKYENIEKEMSKVAHNTKTKYPLLFLIRILEDGIISISWHLYNTGDPVLHEIKIAV